MSSRVDEKKKPQITVTYECLTSAAEREWRAKNVPLYEHEQYFDRCDQCLTHVGNDTVQ